MSNFAAFCVTTLVVIGLLGCLVVSLHRLYEAEKKLARNANREWDEEQRGSMRTVYLYGSLAEQFGACFRLDVRSLAEAAHALGCQLPGFRAAIEAGRFRVTCGAARGKGLHLDNSTVTFGLPEGDLHVVPVVRGAGGRSGSIGKIIVGTIIAAATWWAGGPAWLISIGASVALTGASQLLSPQKKNTKEKKSYMFDGADNTGDQGGCVPVVIGTTMVSSTTISAGVSVADSNGVV